MNNIGIIDSHVHIFSKDVVEERGSFFHDKQFRLLYENLKSRLVSKETLFENMNRTGVAKSFCLGFSWIGEEDCMRENDYIISSASESDGKIVPFGTVPLQKRKGIGGFILKMSESGFAGVGEIGFYSTGFREDQEKYLEEVFEACEDLNLRIVLHVNEPVGHSYTGKYFTDINRLVLLISRFKKLKILLSHWGGGLFVYELMPEIKESLSNVWYDTAASVYLYREGIFRTAAESCGIEKIIFGSDYPLLDITKYEKQINNLSKESAEFILNKNALKFLDIKKL